MLLEEERENLWNYPLKAVIPKEAAKIAQMYDEWVFTRLVETTTPFDKKATFKNSGRVKRGLAIFRKSTVNRNWALQSQ